ncbi:Helicase domino [Gryllus bimaculatus]|nr:Helicase domino [Gryllus bimaculatus]
MTSRLDRLFVLLETGSSGVTRRAAAHQLGEVQRLHPHELHNLLARITTYLRSPAWETRIAAGQAVEAVIRNVPPWDPIPCSVKETKTLSSNISMEGRMNFEKFDMCKVLENGSLLMGSEGKEYDLEEDMSGLDVREKMARQRQLLNARLGLDVASKIGIDVTELFTSEDLGFTIGVNDTHKTEEVSKKSISEVVQNEVSQVGGLSSREMNRARRKARLAVLKQRSREAGEDCGEEPDKKKIKFEDGIRDAKMEDHGMYHSENVPDSTGSWSREAVDWPFEGFCDQLCQDLFSPSWETRHGSATALREVIRIHGKGAGKVADIPEHEMEEFHQLWLEDVALRLLCVLALDRFGDFVSDQVVAPVRETCAQALGSILHLMGKQSVNGVTNVLLQLLKQKDWEARHGGLLGLKYLLAVRKVSLLSCYIVLPAPGIVYTEEMESPVDCYVKILLVYLNSKSALQRMVTGLVVAEWAKLEGSNHTSSETLKRRLHQCLTECVYFDEIALSFTRLLQETRDFIAMMKHYKLPIDSEKYGSVLTLDQIQQLSGPVTQQLLSSHKLKPKIAETLEERRKAIQGSVSQTSSDQMLLNISTQAALAGAVTMQKSLPEKLNPVVKPLMESVKKEDTEPLQALAASHLAFLVDLCVERTPCPNAKIITNLCTFLRSDTEFSPKIQTSEGPSSDSGVESTSGEGSRTGTPTSFGNNYTGILTLVNQQMSAERAVFRRSNSTGGRGPGRPPVTDIPLEELFAAEDGVHKQNRIQRRGASFALTSISSYFGKDLPSKLPKLWDFIKAHLVETVDPSNFDPAVLMNNDVAAEELVTNLLVLEVTSPALHKDLLPQVLLCLPHLSVLLSHPYRAVRHMAARCLGTLSSLASVPVMSSVVTSVLPLLGASESDTQRQGAVEALACIVEKLQLNIIPYIVLLVVPLLGRMSDQNQPVRLMATHCFATLIQLMPLDGGLPEPPSLSADLIAQKVKERKFLEQLFNPKSIDEYKVPVPIKAELRSYQQAGVNWLAFLNKYKLHGILCDDMGLGKTLQSICILAGDHNDRNLQYKSTRSPDSAPLPSIVICPPTLTGHWVYEVQKFLPREYLNPLQYVGPPLEREKLRSKVKLHNLIIASYDIVRKDIDFFSTIKWNYCILDEGHVIKNGKTKSSKAIKQLIANHRLILSGTPIQNNVLELWSLFDFLMPGFLGTEKQFTARYSKPILASRDPKSSPKEQEAGALAMEALHRQVLPFLLRRMKEDVLEDLPPKITQDYYCELSPLQEQLYEDFSRSQAHQSLQETLVQSGSNRSSQGNTHIFQALRYLQNVCNHPKLVLTNQHPEFERIQSQMKQQSSSLADIQHAAKLPALKQLLLDCGIGIPPEEQAGEQVVNQHRALIFCQLKAMLDILENDLFKNYMPGVSYLRLDGSIPSGMRHSVVTRFNNDPSIDVLLLTTQVGGLGLNLTGADTVIFVEHDWNPMKDLQAMDRAHRIGQKKVVNVYRLITRGTLEEKIMGLQKFKLLTANTVISSENASMETMGTDQLLDLFALDNRKKENVNSGSSHLSHTGGMSIKTVLDTLPDLWEDKQYEEEYDLTSFVQRLQK